MLRNDPVSSFFSLRSVPNRIDGNPLASHTIKNDVRSASDYQLPDSGLGSGPAEVGMIP